MQKYRKFTTNRPIAGTLHVGGRAADHDPVALGHSAAKQLVPDRSADQIDLHGSAC